ncbi:hypothetical protein CORC01_05352 [Colletotrichum orchidophilum]|uniref:Fungal N-terminal domain-containing protein n=1 Tax=Colletotrichum orchidophilum TaxID=1209926 RepID=A0A1G4BD53_9PEZI|nr:uncharacterized protein CORC01_05352 [Colletotrichum orchidophilum]OHE99311.1 hypothetical protein CORC01_05352 [Colletotrichum orchidophilum]
MADILGTVVGVVSLGLQLCSGITKYLDGVKGHREDIASASRQCQSLEAFLIQLRDMQSRIAGATNGDAIERAVSSVNAELDGLRTFVDEIRRSEDSSGSFSEWISERKKQAIYPFKRSQLDRLETQLSKANEALQTAIQVAQLYVRK